MGKLETRVGDCNCCKTLSKHLGRPELYTLRGPTNRDEGTITGISYPLRRAASYGILDVRADIPVMNLELQGYSLPPQPGQTEHNVFLHDIQGPGRRNASDSQEDQRRIYD
jgi:hypothetical protein